MLIPTGRVVYSIAPEPTTGDYKILSRIFVTFFLAAAALANRLLGDGRICLFVFRASGPARAICCVWRIKFGLQKYKGYANRLEQCHYRRIVIVKEFAVLQPPTLTC